ncbi:MAG: 16S rRNA (cytidine(1402)-2'-O)-methyltransferase [Burkholderiales bacterium]
MAGREVALAPSLYVVATPLGHLRDITLRALDVLASVTAIYAEDTRVSATLLTRYGIATRPRALHAHNEAARAADVVTALAQGRSVALITDAGTPAISDPGARVVRAVRDAGHAVVPIPGPSALVAALSAAGIGATHFFFAGFLPAKAGERDALLATLADLPAALVFYEAPHRVARTVDALAAVLDGARTLVVARELTKTFETITSMPLADAAAWLAQDPQRRRGEFVLVVDAPPDARGPVDDASLASALRWMDALAAELPPARAAHVVARMTGVARDALYAHATARRTSPDL